MDGRFSIALGDFAEMGSYGGVLTILVLLVLFFFTLEDRRKLRAPIVFLLAHGALLALRWVLPNHARAQGWIGPLGLFTILFATTRSLFLLVFETRLGARVLKPLPKIFRDILQALIYAAVLLATLRAAGVEPSELLTTSALLTAVVGLALQNTLGNIFSGLALQAQRPFEIGDWVEFGTDARDAGQVVEVGWRATKVHTLDEVEVIVPNGKLADMPIRNYTKPSTVSRRTIEVSAAYGIPPERVIAVMEEAARGAPGVLEKPAAFAIAAGFGESGINYNLRYFTDDFRRALRTDSTLRVRLWYAFSRAGIEIPFPRRDVHMLDTSKEGAADAARVRVEKRATTIYGVAVLQGLGPEIIDQLAAESTQRLFAPGETIIRQGDDGDAFVVDRGEVAVLLEQTGDTPVEVARLGPGRAFGEMSLMTGEKRNATVRAVTECELVVVGHVAFGNALTSHPGSAGRISERMAAKQLELTERAKDAERESKATLADHTNELLSRIKSFFKL